MRKYTSPTGSLIIGTAEKMTGIGIINGINDDGTPEYAGTTEVNWDTQCSQYDGKGRLLYVDENNSEWVFEDLTPSEDEADE